MVLLKAKTVGGLVLLLLAPVLVSQAQEGIDWLVEYRASALPQEQGWTAVGPAAANARLVDGALRISDEWTDAMGYFRAPWQADPAMEVVVEARVRVESLTSQQGGAIGHIWAFMDGAPVTLMINDGRREGGLILRPDRVASLVDRVALIDAKSDFRTLRLVIRGRDMSIDVDGVRVIQGEGAFARESESTQPFIQFGSNSDVHRGESYWASVRLGVRKPAEPPKEPKLRITFSEPWAIPSPPRGNPHERPYEHLHGNTRPFLHDMGEGLLLMSVAQGPDAVLEPYGVLKSTDQGKTWEPVKDMQYKSFAPQSILRLPGGDILGVSRWTAKYNREEGVYIGMSYRFDPQAESFRMFESLIRVPAGMGQWMAFNRDIFNTADGAIIASVYGHADTGRRAMLLRSTDEGETWTHWSTLGPRPEPSVVRFSETEMMAVLRTGGSVPMEQIWSYDAGKTWTAPIRMEEGSVDPDMVFMSNGVLACSYGRPGSNLMFSLDRGKTWIEHHVITERRGYNYTAIREISPGRLLFVHDAPPMQALYVDVDRLDSDK